MKRRAKKVLSFLLALMICLGLFPAAAYADNASEDIPEEEITEESIYHEEQGSIITEGSEQDTDLVVEDVVEEFPEVSFEAVDAWNQEDPDEDEETVTEEIIVADSETVCDPDAENDNDALFQAYFEDLLMPHPRLRRPVGASNLSGVDLTLYNILSEKVYMVAQNGGSSIFEIPLQDLGTQLSWTKEELGGITIVSGGKITAEAKAAVSERLDTGNISLVSSALMQDNPYWMYWYNKTTGVNIDTVYSLKADSKSISINSGTTTYSFSVSVDYGSDYTVDSAEVRRVQTAAENARTIVRTYASYPDDDKLTAYKDEICALTSYNYAAAHGGYPYGDPWQAIYVFDGDPETKVVCEGYSKAFEYLCDMTADVSPDVSFSCISVTGTMDGGNHMWNIVTLADGLNYLADITNSDGSTVGTKGPLFLAGYTAGSIWDGYEIARDSSSACYVYSDKTLALMTEEQLTLAKKMSWVLDNNTGVLTISGDGQIDDFEYGSSAEWLANKESIVSVEIESGITGIGKSAFEECRNLTNVTVPPNIRSIGDSAFSGCRNLTSLNVQSIRKAATGSGSSTAEVTIPSSVTRIGDYAFERCSSINTIRFLGGPPEIGQGSFSGVKADAYYYPDKGWEEADKQNYGGALSWIPIIPYYQIQIADGTNGTVTAEVDGAAVTTATGGTTVTLTVTPDTGYELDTLTVMDAADIPIIVIDNQFTMPNGNVTVTAKWVPLAEEIVFTTGLVNDDYTGIHLFVKLPEGENRGDYEVRTYPDKSMYPEDGQTVNLANVPVTAQGCVVQNIIKAASTEMTDIVKVELLKNGEVVKEAEYSVNSVVQERLASGTLNPAREKLNRTLVQYGRCSQERFGHKTDDKPPYDDSVEILDIPGSYAHQPDPTTFGAYISNFTARINLAESVQIWAFLTPAAGYSLKDFDISISTKADGPKAQVIEGGGMILVKITGIRSYDMDKDIQIIVKLKGADTGATWTRSLISCAYDNFQTSTDPARQNLMKALYTYFLAAKERFLQA